MTDETKDQIDALAAGGLLSVALAQQLRRGPSDVLDEIAARKRLGMWLAAEPGRTWDIYTGEDDIQVALLPDRHGYEREGRRVCKMISGDGPTLAAAICAALEKANA